MRPILLRAWTGRNGQIEDLEIPHRRGAETELADLYVGRHQHGGKKPTLLAMSVRSIGGEDYYIALVVGEKFPH